MHRICLTLLMADQTIEHFAISGTGMAGRAFAPLSLMGAGKYREELGIMIDELPALTGGVAEVAFLTVV